MAADIVIRRAQPADMAPLVALCVEHAAYEGIILEYGPDPSALHAALFSDAAPLICWVVECAGDLLGYATATQEFSTWQAAYYLHMDCLYLKPEGRSRGLGKQLARTLANDALRLHCNSMQWQTPVTNVDAAVFYRRIGAQSKDKLRFYLSAKEMQALAGC